MTMRPRLLIPLTLAVVVLVTAGYEFHFRRSAAAAPTTESARNEHSLRQLMRSRLHEEYTAMSFTIWHDQPLTQEKMDKIAVSSANILAITKELDSYEAEYRLQGWSAQDVKFFDDKRVQLTRVAEELKKAAEMHDSSQVTSFFMHLDNTCQSCHQRFRPDLSWT